MNPEQPHQNLFERIIEPEPEANHNVRIELVEPNKNNLENNDILSDCDETFAEFDNNEMV